MKRDLRIVFLGTPDFAVSSLDILIQNDYNVVGVITAPDRPAGRGNKLRPSPIKEYAVEHNLTLLQPTNLKNPEFLEALKALNANLQIVVAFRMLPVAVWDMPELGTFNLHASLLPQYRGAAPINRAIMNGEVETGATTFFLKHEIDTGSIILQHKVPISDTMTAGELHDRLMADGAELVLQTVKAIEEDSVTPKDQSEFIQPDTQLREAPKIFKPDCRIDWNQSTDTINNHIRGLSPYPTAWTEWQDASGKAISFKIFSAQPVADSPAGEPGTVQVVNGRLLISTGSGALEILELQQAGKKRIPSKDFLLGFPADQQWKAI